MIEEHVDVVAVDSKGLLGDATTATVSVSLNWPSLHTIVGSRGGSGHVGRRVWIPQNPRTQMNGGEYGNTVFSHSP